MSPHTMQIKYKRGKRGTFLRRNLADTTLIKWSKLTSPVMGQADPMCRVIPHPEKDAVPLLWSC